MGFMIRDRPKDVSILKDEFKAQERSRINAERSEAKIGSIRSEARREAEREFMSRPERVKADLSSAGRKAQSIFGSAASAGKKVTKAFSGFNDGFRASGFGSNLRAAAKSDKRGLQSQFRK